MTKARWSSPEVRARLMEGRDKTDGQRATSSARAKRLVAAPAIRQKISATLKGRAFSGRRGGNGTLTPEQVTLQRALGWAVEYPITTGDPSWPWASVELANPALKIAVECDGA